MHEISSLSPLDQFYAQAGEKLPDTEFVEGGDIPEPYRQLLVHDRDMTPTLEAYHGGQIHLQVIAKRQDEKIMAREVVLLLNGNERAVEFGAIVIHLSHFPAAARQEIIECKRPLGTILSTHDIQHESRPQAFIRVSSDSVINQALHLNESRPLYGRRNMLIDMQGNTLADIVEILPP